MRVRERHRNRQISKKNRKTDIMDEKRMIKRMICGEKEKRKK